MPEKLSSKQLTAKYRRSLANRKLICSYTEYPKFLLFQDLSE